MTPIDLDAPGKAWGSLAVPHSRATSAWGLMPVPIARIKGASDGPTVLFVGGNHGDELEGPIALLELARQLDPADISGRVLILPTLNPPAVDASLRTSPVDGGNMNRSFPGDRRGTLTQRIAARVYEEVLPRCDAVIDLHAGGRSLEFFPCTVCHQLEDKELQQKTLDLVRAFDAPVGLVLEELDAQGTLDDAVEQMGKLFVSTELGGAGRVTQRTVGIAKRGVRHALMHLGVLDGELPKSSTRLMTTPDLDGYAFAEGEGLFEPLGELGDEVVADQPVGRLHPLVDPSQPPTEVRVKTAGTLMCLRALPRTGPGDCLAVVGQPYEG